MGHIKYYFCSVESSYLSTPIQLYDKEEEKTFLCSVESSHFLLRDQENLRLFGEIGHLPIEIFSPDRPFCHSDHVQLIHHFQYSIHTDILLYIGLRQKWKHSVCLCVCCPVHSCYHTTEHSASVCLCVCCPVRSCYHATRQRC